MPSLHQTGKVICEGLDPFAPVRRIPAWHGHTLLPSPTRSAGRMAPGYKKRGEKPPTRARRAHEHLCGTTWLLKKKNSRKGRLFTYNGSCRRSGRLREGDGSTPMYELMGLQSILRWLSGLSVTRYYAPPPRFGTPEEFKYFGKTICTQKRYRRHPWTGFRPTSRGCPRPADFDGMALFVYADRATAGGTTPDWGYQISRL